MECQAARAARPGISVHFCLVHGIVVDSPRAISSSELEEKERQEAEASAKRPQGASFLAFALLVDVSTICLILFCLFLGRRTSRPSFPTANCR